MHVVNHEILLYNSQMRKNKQMFSLHDLCPLPSREWVGMTSPAAFSVFGGINGRFMRQIARVCELDLTTSDELLSLSDTRWFVH